MEPRKKNDFPGHVQNPSSPSASLDAGQPPCHSVLVSFLPRLADLTNRLVTTFWLRNDSVTRRLKTSKPQGLTQHLVHTPTRHCLLFVLRTSTPPARLTLPSFYIVLLLHPLDCLFRREDAVRSKLPTLLGPLQTRRSCGSRLIPRNIPPRPICTLPRLRSLLEFIATR